MDIFVSVSKFSMDKNRKQNKKMKEIVKKRKIRFITCVFSRLVYLCIKTALVPFFLIIFTSKFISFFKAFKEK